VRIVPVALLAGLVALGLSVPEHRAEPVRGWTAYGLLGNGEIVVAPPGAAPAPPDGWRVLFGSGPAGIQMRPDGTVVIPASAVAPGHPEIQVIR
jgi:hypothetical protein